MKDNRVALEIGYQLEDSDNRKIKINSEVGRGANCIVYDAAYSDSIGMVHIIRIKECYPSYLLMKRTDNGTLMPSDTYQNKFITAKERFIQSYQRNVAITNTLGLTNFTINSADIFSYNNTYYSIIALNEGNDYSKYEDLSLMELLVHIKSLAQLIKKYHDKGYLHLDIKPENVFILPETQEHILLFDFDSVMTKEELASIGRYRLPFSDGFSPPEQIQGKINKIDTHTDIFAIGALLFFKLFGRKATIEECRLSSSYEFNKMRYFSEKYQPKLFHLLEIFFKNTLSASIIPRWKQMDQLIDCLDTLIPLSDIEGVYLMDSFQYNTACFIGRESEIDKMHSILKNNQLLFVSGIGGIGKTELVKRYANRYRNLYDTIVFTVFDKNIVSLVNDEILINRIEKDEMESDTDYFKRKIEILKQIVTDKDLIIIDNFDVDFDDNLETLFSCPCKFIVTSRMDFRDFNYPQITVDKMESIDDVLNLFFVYNDIAYDTEDAAAIEKLVEYVGYHTMTVELIAKYLRVSGEAPAALFDRFMEKEGTTNTKDISVRQRKDRMLRAESVNNHLTTLFDVSGFEAVEKEVIGSLSFFANIRMKKQKFEEICPIDNISEKLEKLIRRGWIEYNEKTDKISLHQVIQDLIYKNLKPNAENCPNVVCGMSRYITADTDSYSEKRMKPKVFDVFMSRITGTDIPYARLCLLYAQKEKLDEAEQICLHQDKKETYDILQQIYRKKLKIISDCDDMFESELNTDDYLTNQLGQMEELLDKAMMCCQRGTQDTNHIIKEYMNLGSEMDYMLAENMWWYSDERNPKLDRIYYRIIEIYDIVTELLPESSYSVDEKENYYKKIQDFYSDEDYFFLYRCEFFSNVEKAYKYQERIDKLRMKMNGESADIVVRDGSETKYLYAHDISCSVLARKYEKEGEYKKAIEYYKKAYEDGDEWYESFMQSIAHIYPKMGEPEKAIECLEEVLDRDKANENDPDVYFSYTAYVCTDLIMNLIKLQDYEKAKLYALELIHYEEPDVYKEDNSYAVTYVLAAYYYLYIIENEPNKKALFWQQCIKYYKMLQNNKIEEDIFDFIEEYLIKEDVCFEEIFAILDRIDNYNTKDIKEKLIVNFIAKNRNADGFDKYHVILMIEYAKLFNEYPYELIKEAESNCEKAQELYLEYGLQDKYIQSLLYQTKAKIMSNEKDYDSDQELELRKKCDYSVLAQNQFEKTDDNKERIEIWKDAADSYRYVDNYEMQIECLKKSLEILNIILNQYEYSQFNGDYWYIMGDLIRASIQLGNLEKAQQYIDELYKNAIEFYRSIENSDSSWERTWKIWSIAELYIESASKEKAVNTYLAAMYIGLVKDSNQYEILKNSVADINICRLSQTIDDLLDDEIENDMIDKIIDIKNELVNYRDDYQEDKNVYDEIISKINDFYQNQEIEFKK